jgi:hypothetical protein
MKLKRFLHGMVWLRKLKIFKPTYDKVVWLRKLQSFKPAYDNIVWLRKLKSFEPTYDKRMYPQSNKEEIVALEPAKVWGLLGAKRVPPWGVMVLQAKLG